jgi:hypothetical protein
MTATRAKIKSKLLLDRWCFHFYVKIVHFEFVMTTIKDGIKKNPAFLSVSYLSLHSSSLYGQITISCPVLGHVAFYGLMPSLSCLLLICSFHRHVCYKLLWYSALFHSCMLFPVTPIMLDPTFEHLLKFKII